MERAIRRREQQPEVVLPDSFENLERWAAQSLGDNIELLPRALKAARKSLFEDPPLAYQALLLMCDAYVPMRRGLLNGSKERWEDGLRQLGLECSPTFSGPGAGENPNDFFVNYLGRRTEIDMHLKGSNSRDPRYCFRLYFFWSSENRRAVVAWLPSHLDTRLT
jgi:hypothetical protein